MIRHPICAVVCSVLAATFLSAQEPAKPAPAPAPATKEAPKPDAKKPASVFLIVNVQGKHEVMNKEAFDAKNKQVSEDHAKAMEAYDKEKKAAEASHKKFDAAAPKKTLLTAEAGEYPTKAEADAALKKIEEAKKKAAEKPAEKPTDKPKDK